MKSEGRYVLHLSTKMEQAFTGSFQENGRSPGELHVDKFEVRFAEKYGQVMGLTTPVKYISLNNLSTYHLAFLIHCERALGRHVIYISKESDLLLKREYASIVQYTTLS